jgi:hypothetical protein
LMLHMVYKLHVAPACGYMAFLYNFNGNGGICLAIELWVVSSWEHLTHPLFLLLVYSIFSNHLLYFLHDFLFPVCSLWSWLFHI